MKDPMPINLMPTAEVRSLGWQAESRDADGHLLAMHAPFGPDDDEGIAWFVRECTSRGETVTIWPIPSTPTPNSTTLLSAVSAKGE